MKFGVTHLKAPVKRKKYSSCKKSIFLPSDLVGEAKESRGCEKASFVGSLEQPQLLSLYHC
jgi:hypothetical protein